MSNKNIKRDFPAKLIFRDLFLEVLINSPAFYLLQGSNSLFTDSREHQGHDLQLWAHLTQPYTGDVRHLMNNENFPSIICNNTFIIFIPSTN